MTTMKLEKWDPYKHEQQLQIEKIAKKFSIPSPQETKNSLLFENGAL